MRPYVPVYGAAIGTRTVETRVIHVQINIISVLHLPVDVISQELRAGIGYQLPQASHPMTQLVTYSKHNTPFTIEQHTKQINSHDEGHLKESYVELQESPSHE